MGKNDNFPVSCHTGCDSSLLVRAVWTFGTHLDVALKAPLVSGSDKTIVSSSIWGKVSNMSSSVDYSKRLGDGLLRCAFLKAKQNALWPWKLAAVEVQIPEFVFCSFCVMLGPGEALGICQVPFLRVRWMLLEIRLWALGVPGCWNPLIPGLGCICAGYVREGPKQLSLASGDLLVTLWTETAKSGLCGFWSLAITAELHMGGFLMCLFSGSHLGLEAVKHQCSCRKKDDEMGCVALLSVAVSPLNRVGLLC